MRDDDLRVAGELASDDELLGVAARELSRALPQCTHALHVKFTDGLGGRLAHGRPWGALPGAISASGYLADTEIIDDRQTAGDPKAETIGRDAGDAEIAQALRRRPGSVSGTFDFDRSANRCAHAGERFHEFGLAITADAGDAVDLASADMEARVVDGEVSIGTRGPQAFDRDARLARHRGGGTVGRSDRSAHRKPRKFGGVGRTRIEMRHGSAPAHDRDPIGE